MTANREPPEQVYVCSEGRPWRKTKGGYERIGLEELRSRMERLPEIAPGKFIATDGLAIYGGETTDGGLHRLRDATLKPRTPNSG